MKWGTHSNTPSPNGSGEEEMGFKQPLQHELVPLLLHCLCFPVAPTVHFLSEDCPKVS